VSAYGPTHVSKQCKRCVALKPLVFRIWRIVIRTNISLSITWARSLQIQCAAGRHILLCHSAISVLFFLLFRWKFWVLKSRSIVQKFQNRIHPSASWSSRLLQDLHMSVVLGTVLFIVQYLALASCLLVNSLTLHGTYWCTSLPSPRSARATGIVLLFLIRCLVKWSKR